jgi:hypothetical protein
MSNPLNRSPHRRDVVLPDGVHNLRGYIKPPTADIATALSPGGKHHGIPTGVVHWVVAARRSVAVTGVCAVVCGTPVCVDDRREMLPAVVCQAAHSRHRGSCQSR